MFGIDLIDAAFLPAALVALVAGLLSFLSPCVLPIVPPYLAYMGGVSMGELREGRRSAVLPAIFFVLGLSTVFLLMGLAASAMGQFFLAYREWFGRISGLVIIGLGLHFLGLYRIGILDREARIDAGDRGGSTLGAYVLGLAFAFGWTPCIGPQLGAILSIAAQGGSLGRGTALLAVYAGGLGIPFLLAAVFISRAIGVMNRIKRHMGLIEKTMGALLVIVGLLLLTNAFSALSFWLLETFPALAQLG
ncbi:MAG: cytochrome c biogenesis CcdA family protein [Paenirhodobacter sp.]|uniref:cytochrome c biogenesis CcdA family protein n=1 Tax=Paenirhodobacter sp. TaxID=1965326 RepID=UPI003D098AE4